MLPPIIYSPPSEFNTRDHGLLSQVDCTLESRKVQFDVQDQRIELTTAHTSSPRIMEVRTYVIANTLADSGEIITHKYISASGIHS